MRTLVALLVVAGGLSSFAEPADAQQTQRAQEQSAGTNPPSKTKRYRYRPMSATDNPAFSANTNPAPSVRDDRDEALRARYADPAGDYLGLPDWARAALGVDKPGGR